MIIRCLLSAILLFIKKKEYDLFWPIITNVCFTITYISWFVWYSNCIGLCNVKYKNGTNGMMKLLTCMNHFVIIYTGISTMKNANLGPLSGCSKQMLILIWHYCNFSSFTESEIFYLLLPLNVFLLIISEACSFELVSSPPSALPSGLLSELWSRKVRRKVAWRGRVVL